jgi:hypothetical protein
MIISASYRTDIPAFYAEWFLRRLEAGRARVRNPYSGKPAWVDLRPGQVTGIVFWTRNFGPLLQHLEALKAFGRPFVTQFTVTGYPRSVEAAVIEPEKAIRQIRRLSGEVHPQCAVWRYDPILFTSELTADFHRRNFESLAARLAGAVDEVVISFAQIYRKSERNLNVAAGRAGFAWRDPSAEEKLALVPDLCAMAEARGMRLTVCTQPEFVTGGAGEARCVDVRRLSAIAGCALEAPISGNRPGCACHQSRDIGEYDTCPHGCAYCYAVRHRALAMQRYKEHDPMADSLIPIAPEPPPVLPLFDQAG